MPNLMIAAFVMEGMPLARWIALAFGVAVLVSTLDPDGPPEGARSELDEAGA